MRSIIYEADAKHFGEKPDDFANTKAEGRDCLAANDFAEKLVKYIPGETLAFFLPAYIGAQATGEDSWRWGVLIIGALGTVAYAHIRSKQELGRARPVYAYVLAMVAFLAWAFGTSAAGSELIGLTAPESDLLLALTVFVVPAVDQLLGSAPAVSAKMWVDPASRKYAGT